MVTYGNPPLRQGAQNIQSEVLQLQRDLRALGYLPGSIDGDFGNGTTLAVRRLKYDLFHNAGSNGAAPVAIDGFRGAVAAIDGIADAALADAIGSLLADAAYVQVPRSSNPAAANQAALQAVRQMTGAVAPIPFMLAIFQQESDMQHFKIPSAANMDDYVVIGLDNNPTDAQRAGLANGALANGAQAGDIITSRGYGLGQYTIFHHPPTAAELQSFILDPVKNVSMAFGELQEKFRGYLVGPADTADDRKAEHPGLALRVCRYSPGDARYMMDCQACAAEVPKIAIGPQTPQYYGAPAADSYASAIYAGRSYANVPDRAAFLCDWPYAVRRYNGSGPASYNYQAIILANVLTG